MGKNNNSDSNDSGGSNERLTTNDTDKAKAEFDYAIEYYVNGLEFWPDAVEDGCKPLHGCAVARRQTGGKKPGFGDTMKRSMNDKDAKQALVNSFWLFGRDPDNLSFMQGIVKNGTRLGAAEAARWAAGILFRALESTAKSTPKQLQTLAELLETLGDRAAEYNDSPFAVSVYQMGVDALNVWYRRNPKDRTAETKVRDLSTKLTIHKGRYQQSESFRDSMTDREEQAELHDKARSVQSEDRMAELVAKAAAVYEENPDDQRALRDLVELLCRPEKDEGEKQAIAILVDRYKATDDYRHKQLADDIRMKQLARRVRLAAKAGDQKALQECQIASLRYDLAAYKDRVKRYPTDNRIKFEYAARLFHASRFDDAIPFFQTARSDPKNRTACAMFLGRCFFRKAYHSQAIKTLQDELATYEFADDDLAKSMLYWLGRAEEASGDVAAARETYGKILQMDYNYKDVRAKLDALPPPG
ncbi:MAG: tetratricopeptide repeat protein [Planctomycetota bacterium]|jgi:tetratricopeptide (TPR) repeat protein